MALLVKKFGGTSVGTIKLIQQLAVKLQAERARNNDIIVVLSAMEGKTDELIQMVETISTDPNKQAYDLLVSTGEQMSIALLTIALNELGVRAKAYTGAQVAIHTDSVHTKARIERIDTETLRRDLRSGYIVVVAGFQGVDTRGAITTLGRGGSDTTAVALAASMHAKECQIYTDVKGVYTCDPRIVNNARKLDHITCEEMMELAGTGAKVLQIRSVSFASKYQVPLRVLSSFDDHDGGTLIDFEEGKNTMVMENPSISGISLDKEEAQITITGIDDAPGVAAQIIGAISKKDIVIDMIVQNTSHDKKTDFTFTVHRNDYQQARQLIVEVVKQIGADSVMSNDRIAKLSIVGIGMRSNAGVAYRMFDALAKENINILMISTSEIKISVAVDQDYAELAARVLHREFKLDYAEEDF